MCWVGWLCVLCLLAQWCLTLCDPVDYSPPGSSVRADSPGKNTGVGCHALLQGIFPTQGLNPHLLHCRWILYCLRCQVSPLPNSCLFQEPQKGNLRGNKVTADVRDLGEVILGWVALHTKQLWSSEGGKRPADTDRHPVGAGHMPREMGADAECRLHRPRNTKGCWQPQELRERPGADSSPAPSEGPRPC